MNYLLEKVRKAPLQEFPFPHLCIENFLSPEDWNALLKEEKMEMKTLFDKDYKIYPPRIDLRRFLRKHERGMKIDKEVRLRRSAVSSEKTVLAELGRQMTSKVFIDTLKKRFELNEIPTSGPKVFMEKCFRDFEEAPNAPSKSDALYFRFGECALFLDSFSEEYWKRHPKKDTFVLPWHWCEHVKDLQSNTLIVFKPSPQCLLGTKTIHGKKMLNRVIGRVSYSSDERKSVEYSKGTIEDVEQWKRQRDFWSDEIDRLTHNFDEMMKRVEEIDQEISTKNKKNKFHLKEISDLQKEKTKIFSQQNIALLQKQDITEQRRQLMMKETIEMDRWTNFLNNEMSQREAVLKTVKTERNQKERLRMKHLKKNLRRR